MKVHHLLGLCAGFALAAPTSLYASIAYGTLNNFDTVNDTEHECHGFEIELEDLDSSDISHTYNYNHYGVAKIEVDSSDPAHPLCRVRWESAKNSDGSWAAYTSIPNGPIDPTNGHQFTNPNVNFGGEHFGVGYRKQPTTVRYYWLIDDGSGNLIHSAPVQVSTPRWSFSGGRVGAVVEAPEPPSSTHRNSVRRSGSKRSAPPATTATGSSCATWSPMTRTTTTSATGATANPMRSRSSGTSCKPSSMTMRVAA
jgi:hypothetical protein